MSFVLLPNLIQCETLSYFTRWHAIPFSKKKQKEKVKRKEKKDGMLFLVVSPKVSNNLPLFLVLGSKQAELSFAQALIKLE